MPRCPLPNPTVSGKHDRKTHCFIHMPPPVHVAHPKTHNRSSIIAATKSRQPMSGVGPVQSTFPPGVTSVVGNQSFNYSSQRFSNETPLHMYNKEPQFPLHMSTFDEDKRQEFTKHFGQDQQAPVLAVESGQQSHFSPDQGITTFIGEICPVCGETFMDKSLFKIHCESHILGLPSHTDRAENCQELTDPFGQVHQVPTEMETSLMVDLEDSRWNFISPVLSERQSHLTPASSNSSPEILTGIDDRNCLICRLEFNTVHAHKIHMFTHMPTECSACPYWINS